MRLIIAEYRKQLAQLKKHRRSSAGIPGGRVEYRVEMRSSTKTEPPFFSNSRKKVAEQLVIWSCELEEAAQNEGGGHHALFVYARPLKQSYGELISFCKYSAVQESWIHLSGVEFDYDSYDPKSLSETLRSVEAKYEKELVTDPIDDPEVDDDPTPTGQRKRAAWREGEDGDDKVAADPDVDTKGNSKARDDGKKTVVKKALKKKSAKSNWDLPSTVMGASKRD